MFSRLSLGQEIFFVFCKTPTPGLGPTHSYVAWVPGCFPGIKAVEAWCWPLTSIKSRSENECSYCIPLHPLYNFQGWTGATLRR